MSKNRKNRKKDVLSTQEDDRTCHDFSNFAKLETSQSKCHKMLTDKDFILPEEVLKELEALEIADLTDFWNRSYGGTNS